MCAVDTTWTDPSTSGAIDRSTGDPLTEAIYDKILSNLKRLGGTDGESKTGNLIPATSDGGALGSATKMWSDLFLASGGVINFNNGNMTLTHAAGSLAFAGGTVGIGGTSAAALYIVNPSSETYEAAASYGLFIVRNAAANKIAAMALGGSSYNAVMGITTGGDTLRWGFSDGATYADRMKLTQAGVLSTDVSGTSGSYSNVDNFDEHDDAMVLHQGIGLMKPEVLERLGIMEKKEGGWWLHHTPMMALLAGGVYQTRQRMDNQYEQLHARIATLESELATLKGA